LKDLRVISVISINDEIKITLSKLEKNLELTNRVTEAYQKDILYKVITEKYKSQYIKRQRRINALKSPFIKARGVLQGILGENIEEIHDDEVINFDGLIEENERTRIILDRLNFRECIEYFEDTLKYGLNRANKIWRIKDLDH